jgi:hypothetical protein
MATRWAFSELALEDHELGLAVPAVETGTLNRSASILIQAGFNSRLAAIKAVTDTGATFTTGQELRQWLNSEAVAAWSALPDWPTLETKPIWLEFPRALLRQRNAPGLTVAIGRMSLGSVRPHHPVRRCRSTTGRVNRGCSRRTARHSALFRLRSIHGERVYLGRRSPKTLAKST